jgi:hypothetical protein
MMTILLQKKKYFVFLFRSNSRSMIQEYELFYKDENVSNVLIHFLFLL